MIIFEELKDRKHEKMHLFFAMIENKEKVYKNLSENMITAEN